MAKYDIPEFFIPKNQTKSGKGRWFPSIPSRLFSPQKMMQTKNPEKKRDLSKRVLGELIFFFESRRFSGCSCDCSFLKGESLGS